MLKRALRKICYAILLAKVGGPRVFLREFKRRLYSRATYILLEKRLDADSVQVPCRLEYSLRLASEEDMEEVFQKSKSESKESACELLHRRWIYESGFHNCYVARAADTGELCYIQWMITPDDDNVASRRFDNSLPRLKEDEIILDEAYTFEKYRGKGIMPSVTVKLSELARGNGLKRVITHVPRDNVASLKGCEKAGFKKFEEIPELRLLFFRKKFA